MIGIATVFGMTADVTALRGIVPQWTFAERVRKVRRDQRLLQKDFADKLEVGLKAYQAWETGKNTPGDLIGVAEKLEDVTGVPREWFLGWLDPRPDPTTEDNLSGRRDSNSQHSAWNTDTSGTVLRPAFGAAEEVTEEQAA